ncbi:hypothetical protein [Comamonas sp. GCA5]|nr:hypothetical protein [Comamonas aquatica]MDE1556291.1 hypothetical protein [Comamonas aquatica]
MELLDAARQAAVRNLNALMTATHCEIGRRMAKTGQQGKLHTG